MSNLSITDMWKTEPEITSGTVFNSPVQKLNMQQRNMKKITNKLKGDYITGQNVALKRVDWQFHSDESEKMARWKVLDSPDPRVTALIPEAEEDHGIGQEDTTESVVREIIKVLKIEDAPGVKEEKRKIVNKVLGAGSKTTNEFSINGDDWSIIIWTQHGGREIKFKLEHESDSTTLDGRPVKVIFYNDGDKLMEVQKGDTFDSITERIVRGDEMTMLMTGGGVQCTRQYKRV